MLLLLLLVLRRAGVNGQLAGVARCADVCVSAAMAPVSDRQGDFFSHHIAIRFCLTFL